MTKKAEEIKLDIQELNTLLEKASRQRIKDILILEVRRLQTELAKCTEVTNDTTAKAASSLSSNNARKCYEVKLNNYGWDQTNTAVKLYVSLKDVQQLPKESVTCDFTKKSVDLHVLGLENKNYRLQINNLCEEINTEKSHFKVKTDMVVVFLVKQVSKNWSHVTGVEKRINEAKAPSIPDVGEDSDPGASLMNLMKKMYQDGDDEMKKTMAKAWTESQEKNASGLPDYSSL